MYLKHVPSQFPLWFITIMIPTYFVAVYVPQSVSCAMKCFSRKSAPLIFYLMTELLSERSLEVKLVNVCIQYSSDLISEKT